MTLRFLIFSLALVLVPCAVYADNYPPSQSCGKPIKPYKFNSNREVEQFNNDVERYKRCISDFVAEQNEAIDNHKRAAQGAIEEWNRYVRYELN